MNVIVASVIFLLVLLLIFLIAGGHMNKLVTVLKGVVTNVVSGVNGTNFSVR